MTFTGFTENDFDVFLIEGLEKRMEALITHIRPKLENLGGFFAPILTMETGDEMFSHVAKHARRTINPPKDTWVAFSSNPRGYKMVPHFQIGLWETHVFIWFALIYEAPNKQEFGVKLAEDLDAIYKQIPADFVWSTDHTKPESVFHGELTKEDLNAMFIRLQQVKKAEILCGIHITREDAVEMSPQDFLKKSESVFKTLSPLYQLFKR